uniref:Uncharacterized protein n=1 Tax=Acrobeloides nanus TaxID=290746 RepID=A0A914DGS1_9BILA
MTNINGLGPPQPSMTVSYKMDITTYGTHNGVFITTGIQSGGANGVSPWGYFHAQQYPNGAAITQVTGAGQPMIQAPPITPMPNQGFGGSTLNVSGASTTRSQPQIAGTSRSRSGSRSRSRSRPGSPDFDDSPPDEFLQPEKVQLNVFNPVGLNDF